MAETKVRAAQISSSGITEGTALIASGGVVGFGVAGAGYFGNHYVSGSSEAESTNSTTAWVQKLRVSLPVDAAAGTYRYMLSFQIRGDKNNKSIGYRLQLDDTTNILLVEDFRDDIYETIVAFDGTLSLIAGAHDFDVDFRAVDAGVIAYMKNAFFDVWRIS